MGDETPSGQVLEFLTVTSLPHRGVNDEEARRIVRSHAIRDANRRKRLKDGSEVNKLHGAAWQQPPTQSSLTTKFKLNKKPAKEKKETPLQPEIEEWTKCALARRDLQKSSNSALNFALGMGQFDPFDTLPIKLGPRQQALLDYRKQNFSTHP
jgi:hypothetical protein